MNTTTSPVFGPVHVDPLGPGAPVDQSAVAAWQRSAVRPASNTQVRSRVRSLLRSGYGAR